MTDITNDEVKTTATEIAAGEITCSCGVINVATNTTCYVCGAVFVEVDAAE